MTDGERLQLEAEISELFQVAEINGRRVVLASFSETWFGDLDEYPGIVAALEEEDLLEREIRERTERNPDYPRLLEEAERRRKEGV